MDSMENFYEEELKKTLDKPLNKRIVALISEIERRPQLFIGEDINIQCLFHFLNGWQMAAGEDIGHSEASLNEKMNAILALKYNDFNSLNWKSLLICHEGEDAAFRMFFEYFHLVDKQ